MAFYDDPYQIMDNNLSLIGVLQTLFKWRKQIIRVCLIAGIGTAVISLFLPNYYRSTTIFLVASPDQAKPELIFGKSEYGPQYYGNEDDMDRVLTIAESSELVTFIVDSFHLYQHYNIDSTGRKAPFKVRETFLDLYEVKKTKLGAVELSVEDKDPAIAALIATAARERINEINLQIIKAGQQKSIVTLRNDIAEKEKQLKILGDTLAILRRSYGIYNVVAQTEAMAAQYSEVEAERISTQGRLNAFKAMPGVPRDTIRNLEAKVKGKEDESKNLDERLRIFNEGMPLVLAFEKQYSEANQSLSEDREHLKIYDAAYNAVFPMVFMVEEATPAIVKSRPKRSIIVIAAAAIAFLFSVVGIMLFESYKDINWRAISHPE